MKKLKLLFAISAFTASVSVTALFGFFEEGAKSEEVAPPATQEKSVAECEAPSWAKAIGHEKKWKLHNGCPSTETESQPKNHPKEHQEL